MTIELDKIFNNLAEKTRLKAEETWAEGDFSYLFNRENVVNLSELRRKCEYLGHDLFDEIIVMSSPAEVVEYLRTGRFSHLEKELDGLDQTEIQAERNTDFAPPPGIQYRTKEECEDDRQKIIVGFFELLEQYLSMHLETKGGVPNMSVSSTTHAKEMRVHIQSSVADEISKLGLQLVGKLDAISSKYDYTEKGDTYFGDRFLILLEITLSWLLFRIALIATPEVVQKALGLKENPLDSSGPDPVG